MCIDARFLQVRWAWLIIPEYMAAFLGTHSITLFFGLAVESPFVLRWRQLVALIPDLLIVLATNAGFR